MVVVSSSFAKEWEDSIVVNPPEEDRRATGLTEPTVTEIARKHQEKIWSGEHRRPLSLSQRCGRTQKLTMYREQPHALPNTFIHIALQAPVSRIGYPRVELPWVLIGILIPDIPWIVQRLAIMASIGDPFQIRLYCTLQASLFFSLLLALALASFARKHLPVFFVLAASSLLHLLLDALQIKWGNGVHFLIPLSFESTHLGLVWPEHPLGYIATLAGILYLLFMLRTMVGEGISLRKRPFWPWLVPGLASYLLLPLLFMAPLEHSNSNFLETVNTPSLRQGRPIEIDRSFYNAEERTVSLFTGESIAVEGVLPKKSAVVSLKGKFTTPHLIHSHTIHIHQKAYRDYASIAGIAVTAGIWLYLLCSSSGIFNPRKYS